MAKNTVNKVYFLKKVTKYEKNGIFDFKKNLRGVAFFDSALYERELKALQDGKKTFF